MTITNHSPLEYRKIKYDPRKSSVYLCLHCTGRCVDLPRIGVACLRCKCKRYARCTEDQVTEMRAEIIKAQILAISAAFVLANYPPALFNARRTAFAEQIRTAAQKWSDPSGKGSDAAFGVSPN